MKNHEKENSCSFAPADQYIDQIGRFNRTSATDQPFPETTPVQYTFTIEGQTRKYILLDQFANDDAAFYIMQDRVYGKMLFDTQEGHTKFDPNCETNIGYFLNNEFVTEGMGGQSFNSAFVDYIDWDHLWWTEQGIRDLGDEYSAKEDYSFTAGISLISLTEACKYREKIGANPMGDNTWWWSRTERGLNASSHNILVMQGTEFWNMAINVVDRQLPSVRPVFYLSEDFFKNVRIGLKDETTGENLLGEDVRQMLLNRYTREELAGIYTDDELAYIGYDAPSYATVSVEASNGNPTILTANLETEGAVSYNYQWLKRKEAGGEYTEIRGDKGRQYVVSTMDKNDYLNCRVTPVFADGSTGEASMAREDYFVENLGRYSRSSSADYPFPLDTPEEYKFMVAGQGREYILLDEFNDAEAAFYILSDHSYGRYMFDTAGNTKFDPTIQTNIGYALNSEEFKQNGLNGVTLNSDIAAHIDWDHVWWTESGRSDIIPDDYSFTAGVSLLSITEAYKYFGKFGHNLNNNLSWWWTRTQRGVNATNPNILAMKSGDEFWDISPSEPTENQTAYVRPTFFLDEDFFREVKVENMGDEVKRIIRERYAKFELAGLYNEQELEDIGYDPAIMLPEKDNNIYSPEELSVTIDYMPSAMSTVTITAECGGVEDVLYSGRAFPGVAIQNTYKLENVPFGTQDIMITIEEGDELMASFEKTVYAVPEVSSSYGQTKVGTGIGISALENDPSLMENAAALGFNNLRIEFTWNRIEREKGVYTFERFDPIMQKAEECGLDVFALFAYNSKFYGGASNDKDPIDTDEEREAFVNYVTATLEHYPQIKEIEVWNEPNSPGFWNNGTGAITAEDIADYALLVKDVSEAVKAINPDIIVNAGAIDVSKDAVNYIDAMLAEGVYPYMDSLSYHPYFHPSNTNDENEDKFVNERITPYKNVLREYGGFKRIAGSEVGFSSGLFEGVGEDVKKREVPKNIIVLAANNIDYANVFNYQDSTENFGMVDVNGNPNTLFYSMAQLNHELNGAVFIGRLETDPKVRAYVFAKDGAPIIMAWATEETTFEINGAGAKAYDLNGNPVAMSGSVTLDLNPTYIEGADASYFEAANSFERAQRKAAISNYFAELPADISSAIASDSADTKELIAQSGLSDTEKSALLDMIYEIDVIDSAYDAVSGVSAGDVPAARYNTLSGMDGNEYTDAILKYAYGYMQAAEADENIPSYIAAANILTANALLDSAEALLGGAPASEVYVDNISNVGGTLSFEVVNTTGTQSDVYVATYDSGALKSAEKADAGEYSFDVGTLSGKIFVWEKGTMKPLCRVYEF